MEGWTKKNGVYLSQKPPHNELSLVDTDWNALWNADRSMIAVQWTSNFDYSLALPWWYCILDRPFSVDMLNSKVRYEVRKGLKNFRVERISSFEYADKLARVAYTEWQNYDASYRPSRTQNDLIQIYKNHSMNENQEYWGCFLNETDELIGFASCYIRCDYIDFMSMKIPSNYMKMGASYAVVSTISSHYMNSEQQYRYISDGHRNIVHKTNFQEFLVTKFGWKYAYASLHIKYRPWIKPIVELIYPFRNMFKIAESGILNKVFVMLQLEEISRSCKKLCREVNNE